MELILLIRRMSRENVLWGAKHIRDELALLGRHVCITTVAKYMLKHRSVDAGQRWSSFLQNHMSRTAACDFFVVPTITFKLLYGFVVLSHDRRRILHVNVTAHPTAEWAAQQLSEAFLDDTAPRFLLRDRDSIYGWAFGCRVKALGMKPLVTGHKCPWQNPFVERVIGTIRRECLDHVIPLSERHLLRTLREYAAYYNTARTHQSLEGNSPEPRRVVHRGEVVAKAVLGGLHHRYSRAA